MPLIDNNVKDTEPKYVKPFLRWAGGKNWLVKGIEHFMPKTYERYHEPFLGGGAIFFNIKTSRKNSYLSDLNPDLINTYTQIRDNCSEVIDLLKTFKNTKENYYIIRSKKSDDPIYNAAKFIYLNRTSFNGIYRVNAQGVYNVPYGFRNNNIQDYESLILSSAKLSKTTLFEQDFEKSIKLVESKDLVFIDPPYTVAHEKNGFIAYNQKIFSLEDQVRLSKTLKRINNIGAYYILTNAYHEAISDIYKGLGTFHKLQRQSLIGGRGASRGMVNEYLITNVK